MKPVQSKAWSSSSLTAAYESVRERSVDMDAATLDDDMRKELEVPPTLL